MTPPSSSGTRPAGASPWRRARRLPLMVAVLMVLAAACGQDGGGTGGAAEPVVTQPASGSASPDPGPSPVTTATPATASPAASPTVAAASADGLPGEDTSGPEPGTTFAVVGVAADDVLNVRDVPGVEGEVFGELEPLADNVRATGRARLVGDAIWYEIEGDAADDGWVNARYLAMLGDTTDITSQLAERPAAETMLELAAAVAGMRTGEADEGDGPTVVVSDGPSVGDLGEVTIDITGLADDAIAGERLHLFAEPDAGGEGFTLRTVERTLLCARGVSEGLCL